MALCCILTLVGAACEVPVTVGPVAWFVANGSVNEVSTQINNPGDLVELLDHAGTVVASGLADANGSFLFRNVAAGTGYAVRSPYGVVGDLTVTTPDDVPLPESYTAILDEGYNYIPTRDGTLLSANITFPTNGAPGPWPVLVDYSGYDPSSPAGDSFSEAQIFPALGYVVVGVNLRGTTCSGGAFDYFETLQGLDGYDVIETLARQTWSTGRVGMVGISYPGITQLFVAATRPPHLAAITPQSVIADTYKGILYPGGIRNVGFPMDWAADRDADAAMSAHQWVRDRIAAGDQACETNQLMRLQSRNLSADIVAGRPYEALGDQLAPRTFVDRITAPTFISGSYQDEETGGYWASMLSKFAPTTKVRAQLTNGTHIESFGPEHLNRVIEFLEFYVARRKPSVPADIRAALPTVYSSLFGFAGATIEADRFSASPSYASALSTYEAEPKVRVYWENGAGSTAGRPYSTVRSDYTSWPPAGTTTATWYLQPDGALGATAPVVADTEARGWSSYAYDTAAKNPKTTFSGAPADMFKSLPAVTWKVLKEGNALSFVTPAFTARTAYAGSGSADLWLRSTDVDTDLEVTITEVRSDGKETYIQSGWLRASHRAVDATRSDALTPFHSYLADDQEALTPGEWTLARVELFPFAHVFRSGSRLRVNIEVPGGNQALWEVDPMNPATR